MAIDLDKTSLVQAQICKSWLSQFNWASLLFDTYSSSISYVSFIAVSLSLLQNWI